VKGRTQLPEIVNRYMKGEFEIDSFITHRFKFSEINQSFKVLHEGDCIRAVMYFDGYEKEGEDIKKIEN
jgi:S-(hydroxymethyl)glutathione dehydrogenase / alcohol dehydrogenase